MIYFRYRGTNCFFVAGASGGLMAFDAGWPCSLFEYARMMKTVGLRFDDIAWVLVSHMHMDHAGLIGEFLHAGIECCVTDSQFQAIDEMERIILKNSAYRGYKKIEKGQLHTVSVEGLNDMCGHIGVGGEIIATPGHSCDSITYISKDREALIGDLAPRHQIMPEDAASAESWEHIARRGVRVAYPSHAEIILL